METGQALVIISGRMKFITWIPDFTEMYPTTDVVVGRKNAKKRIKRSVGYFDVQEYVKKKKKESMIQKGNPFGEGDCEIHPFEEFMAAREKECKSDSHEGFDVDEMIKKIDAKIAELEAEEAEERNKADE